MTQDTKELILSLGFSLTLIFGAMLCAALVTEVIL